MTENSKPSDSGTDRKEIATSLASQYMPLSSDGSLKRNLTPPSPDNLKEWPDWLNRVKHFLGLWTNRIETQGNDPFEPLTIPPISLEAMDLIDSGLSYYGARGAPKEYATVLHALELHFPRAALSEGAETQFWKDMLTDVSPIPIAMLKYAAFKARNDPDQNYFPRAGALRGYLRDLPDPQSLLMQLRSIQNYTPPEKVERITPERAAQIRKEELK